MWSIISIVAKRGPELIEELEELSKEKDDIIGT